MVETKYPCDKNHCNNISKLLKKKQLANLKKDSYNNDHKHYISTTEGSFSKTKLKTLNHKITSSYKQSLKKQIVLRQKCHLFSYYLLPVFTKKFKKKKK